MTDMTYCADCGHDLADLQETHRLQPQVAVTLGCINLCIRCTEDQLGRRLHAYDFTDALVNWAGPKSLRMRHRQRQPPPRIQIPL